MAWTTAELSSRTVGRGILCARSSVRSWCIGNNSSYKPSEREFNSASAVDRATCCCLLALQVIGQKVPAGPRMTKNRPLVDFAVKGHPPRSASQYKSRVQASGGSQTWATKHSSFCGVEIWNKAKKLLVWVSGPSSYLSGQWTDGIGKIRSG